MDFNVAANTIKQAATGIDVNATQLAADLAAVSVVSADMTAVQAKAEPYARISRLLRDAGRHSPETFKAVAGALVGAFKGDDNQELVMEGTVAAIRNELHISEPAPEV